MGNTDQIALHLLVSFDHLSIDRDHWRRAMQRLLSKWQNTESSQAVLREFLTTETEYVEDWRKTVVNEISGWTGKSLRDFSQASFWKSYDSFDKDLDKVLALTSQRFSAVDEYEVGELDLSARVRAIDLDKPFDAFIVDGQHKMQAPLEAELHHILFQGPVRALSKRAIRNLTKRAVDEIAYAEIATVASLLQLTREVLSRGIQVRVRWRVMFRVPAPSATAPELVREHILGFELRTGNPPPFETHDRRTGAVMVPAIIIQAPKVKHEQVRKRNSSRNLRMAVRERYRRASLHRHSQTPASPGGCPQSTGCRRLRSDLQLAERARPAWHSCRRQVVFDVRMDRAAGCVRNTARAEVTTQKGVR